MSWVGPRNVYFLKGSPGQLKNNRLVAELGLPMSSTLDGIIFAFLGRDLLKRAVAMGLGRKQQIHGAPLESETLWES